MSDSGTLQPRGDARYDVAVVGFGPVGAFTALLLAGSGLRVALLERSQEPVVLPRAVGLDGESMRAFQRVGLGDAVAAILQPPREPDEVCFTDSRRRRLFGLEIPAEGHNGWRDLAYFDQPELEALLRDLVAREERIDVFMGHQVMAVDPAECEVLLRSRADAGERELRAAFVIGCDGASSFVRGALGIPWLSLGYDQDWLVVDIVQGPEAELPLATMQVCDPERLATYVCVKDPQRRWEFQLLPGETREEMLRPERIEALLRPWLPPEHYAIRRAAVYQFHAATAARWREGRVFLAGDAAHQTPPFLGQGLNAGFRDAVNLGWKLPLVHAGVCDAALLESYAAERDAHARDLVEWAVAVGKLMETLAAREAGRPDPHPASDPSAGYGQGRTAPPLRGGVLVDDQVCAGRPVGTLLRQPRVRAPEQEARAECPEGRECRLDELLGAGFSVVARKEGDLRMGPEAAALLRRLGGRALSLEGLEVTGGETDRLFDAHPAAVLRPDRYVFGVVDEAWSLDRLLQELGRKLAAVTGGEEETMVVLITGASGGLGSVLGATLLARGMTVYGTRRDPTGREGEHPFPMLPMEVTDPASVERCVKELIAREGRLDVVVNCVNQMIIGTVEETTLEEVEALYATNVFGVLRVCKAVLPAMRAQGRGTIVNLSSLGGLLAVPTMSAYTSAKFALEAMSEALYHEVKPHGIDVVIPQPVAMAMERPATGDHLRLVAGVTPDSPSHGMLARMARDTAASRLTPQAVAEKIADVITRESKPLRVPMDRARAVGLLKGLAPQWVIDRLMRGLTK